MVIVPETVVVQTVDGVPLVVDGNSVEAVVVVPQAKLRRVSSGQGEGKNLWKRQAVQIVQPYRDRIQ